MSGPCVDESCSPKWPGANSPRLCDEPKVELGVHDLVVAEDDVDRTRDQRSLELKPTCPAKPPAARKAEQLGVQTAARKAEQTAAQGEQMEGKRQGNDKVVSSPAQEATPESKKRQ